MITVQVKLEIFLNSTWFKPWFPTGHVVLHLDIGFLLTSSGLLACVSMEIRLPKTHSAAI